MDKRGCVMPSLHTLKVAGGLRAKPPAAGGTGVWGRSLQRSKVLHFFAKIA